MFIGTAYFKSRQHALEYYAKQKTDEAMVDCYIENKMIHIGYPKIALEIDPNCIITVDKDGRYWKRSK